MAEHQIMAEQPAGVHNETLRGHLEEVAALRLDVQSIAHGLSGGQFAWRPSARGWSVGQCIEHITRTLRLYPEKIEAMIVEARDREARGERPFREGAFTRWFVRSMEPPPGMRVRTMRMVDPPAALDRDVVLAGFDAELTRFAGLVLATDGVSLQHARTRSPFFSLLQFTLGQVFALNLAHARRHVWQARQVTQQPGFPQA
jgi:hypothetical protein